jgi:hypothetical protein
MSDALRLGLGPLLVPVPGLVWKRQVRAGAARLERLLASLSPDHRRVRNFVVDELTRHGRPIGPDHVARELQLPVERVRRLLEELEAKLLFLFRDGEGAVEWAYPFTAAATPHRLLFDGGEEAFAA